MVYGMAWQDWHCLWCGLASMTWYLVWPRRAWRGIRYYLGRHGMIYGMAWRAWHGICYGLTGIWYSWRTWHGIWYDLAGRWFGVAGNGMIHGMTWRAMPRFMIWPGSQGIVHNMAWRAWHCTWYGLTGTVWYMLWPGGHGMVWYVVWPGGNNMVYSMAWRAWRGIWYGLIGMAWYMLWPGGHDMVYGQYQIRIVTGDTSNWQSFTRTCDQGSWSLALTREVNLATEYSAPSAAERRESVSEFQSLKVGDGGLGNCSCKCQYLQRAFEMPKSDAFWHA